MDRDGRWGSRAVNKKTNSHDEDKIAIALIHHAWEPSIALHHVDQRRHFHRHPDLRAPSRGWRWRLGPNLGLVNTLLPAPVCVCVRGRATVSDCVLLPCLASSRRREREQHACEGQPD
jgi:hypothetical protein